MTTPIRHWNNLADYVLGRPLSVDGVIDDGGRYPYSVKGCEIEGTVLFADIADFSGRTYGLSPTEVLVFTNHFFGRITRRALKHMPGIIDKYVGDAVMIVFSKAFGSADPFSDALKTAREIAHEDPFAFRPHIGLAAGSLTVGFVGAELKYDCTVFGAPVILAKRCCDLGLPENGGAVISFPSTDRDQALFDEVFAPGSFEMPDGTEHPHHQKWDLLPPMIAKLKNLPDAQVTHIVRNTHFFPNQTVEDRAREALADLKARGFYRPGLLTIGDQES